MSYRSYKDLGANAPAVQPYKVMECQNLQHKHDIIKNNGVVCVYIYADWCKPCKHIAPDYAVMAKKYAGTCTLIKENIDLKLTQNVQAVPTFVFFYRGQFHSAITGANLADVESTLGNLLQEADKMPDTHPPSSYSNPSGNSEALYRQNYGQDPHPQAYPSFNQ